MRWKFLLSSAKLILIGVVCGMLARFILGDPETSTEHSRTFNSPIDEKIVDRKLDAELPDFPLPHDWSSDSVR